MVAAAAVVASVDIHTEPYEQNASSLRAAAATTNKCIEITSLGLHLADTKKRTS